ncbi:bifunctional apoptosis regulator-like isoform X2 [Bufo gargarizans]|uniref:bifunctional apoptosis regulator-like isoform X2 n=1 Tax=Bufo gargarizans TaxID=30331 RepID=UPI001CF4C0D6|nr:bifunctional apoptosis regulator-like isoform X2 [Bufo gargarizans]
MEEDVQLESDNCERSSGVKLDRNISVSEFSCNCCYDILVNPTTLKCGHSFCRHCLALWWLSSKKTECPVCSDKWEECPKVNMLLREVIKKLFPDTIKEKYEAVEQNIDIVRALQVFNQYGNEQNQLSSREKQANHQRDGGDHLITILTGVAIMLLLCHWSYRESEHDFSVHKPVIKCTPEEVVLWLEQLGPWTSHYKDRFLSGMVNGRLLLTLSEDEFSKEPYSIESSSHRKSIIMELERVKTLGVKLPQNKAVNPRKSLVLFYVLKTSPRLSMLGMYLFDYTETFLPFIHSTCPLQEEDEEDVLTKFRDLQDPTWTQWREFLVKYVFLPYQLLAEFAWDWLEIHYWTSRFIIVKAMINSRRELHSFYILWRTRQRWSVSLLIWGHLANILAYGLCLFIFWTITPQFICNFVLYYDMYIISSYYMVVKFQELGIRAI